MKKRIAILLSACMLAGAVSFAGCGSNDAKSSGSEKTSAVSQAEAKKSGDGFTAADLTCVINGKKIDLNEDMSSVLSKLGEAKNVTSEQSCHGKTGEDKTYEYEGFSVFTYPDGDTDKVIEITIKAEGMATPKGISVGSKEAEIKEKYGDDVQKTGKYLSYTSGDKSLNFGVENGVVNEIDYYYDGV